MSLELRAGGHLEWDEFAVRHVMNITDVGHLVSDADTSDVKLERRAHRDGASA